MTAHNEPMLRAIAVAAVQTAAHDRPGFAAAWPALRTQLRDAAASGARLVVMPEGTLPGYVLGYEPYDGSEIAAALEECRSIAREHACVIVVGAARADGGHIYNSAVVIDADGSLAGRADKVFLWHFDRQWFEAGANISPVRTAIGSLGVLVCADGRIPTISRALVDAGAELLVMPTAWVTSGRDPQNLENVQADLFARVRARENGVPFIAANKCGVESACVAYCGKSQIVAADGEIGAIASQESAQILTGEIAIGSTHPPRAARLRWQPPEHLNRAARIAICARDIEDETALELHLRRLEAELLIMPESTYPSAGGDRLAFSYAGDEHVRDPGALVDARLDGCDLLAWNAHLEAPWQERFARTRALELRMYVVTFDAAAKRAYAIDPDGTVLCGTFGKYEIASFSYDPARAAQTTIAPGTDVREGLLRAQRVVGKHA